MVVDKRILREKLLLSLHFVDDFNINTSFLLFSTHIYASPKSN